MKRAVVALSGGVDSTVVAHIARKEVGVRGELYPVHFNYGQLHQREYQGALKTVEILKAEPILLLDLPLGQVAKSALLGDGDIPEVEEDGIPPTWVPQRNSIFLSFAYAYAETVDADRIYVGVNSQDYSGYPDCRPEFIQAMQRSLNLASKRYVEDGHGTAIFAPLQTLTKAQIIQTGLDLGVNFSNTWSCYRGGDRACGCCPSCEIRLMGFKIVGLEDPIEYDMDIYGGLDENG